MWCTMYNSPICEKNPPTSSFCSWRRWIALPLGVHTQKQYYLQVVYPNLYINIFCTTDAEAQRPHLQFVGEHANRWEKQTLEYLVLKNSKKIPSYSPQYFQLFQGNLNYSQGSQDFQACSANINLHRWEKLGILKNSYEFPKSWEIFILQRKSGQLNHHYRDDMYH